MVVFAVNVVFIVIIVVHILIHIVKVGSLAFAGHREVRGQTDTQIDTQTEKRTSRMS